MDTNSRVAWLERGSAGHSLRVQLGVLLCTVLLHNILALLCPLHQQASGHSAYEFVAPA
jgi:hypothetical protein